MALQILYPNGEVMACQMYIWDVNTLSPVVWDGSVTFSGSITIGSVDQGSAGTDPWLVELSGSSTVSVDNFPATQPVSIAAPVAVTGPLTDTQLRASAVPTSLATIPNPSNLDVALSTRTKPSDQQHTIIDSAPTIAVTNAGLTDLDLALSTSSVGSGTFNGSGSSLIIDLTTQQHRSLTVYVPSSSTLSASLSALPSYDGGLTYVNVASPWINFGVNAGGQISVGTFSNTGVAQIQRILVPTGADHIKIAPEPYFSGSGTVSVFSSAMSFEDLTSFISVLSGWEDGNSRAKVSPISGQVGIAAGAGASGANTTRVIVASGTTSIAKAEDVASADGDTGVPSMAIRKASPANTSNNDGDYEMLQMSAGRLWASATIDSAIPAGSNVIGHVIADSGSTTVVTGNVTVVQPTGSNLHAVIDSGTVTTVSTVTNVTTVGTITNPVTVQATDLDIRNLIFATDKVDVSGSTITATVDTSLLATAANQTTEIASLAAITTNTNPLKTAQGADATSVVGSLVQGRADVEIQTTADNLIQPMSLDQFRRLRVITSNEESLESAWDQLLPDPWNINVTNSGFDVSNKITIDTAWS